MDVQISWREHVIYYIAECADKKHKKTAQFYCFQGVVHSDTNANIILF